MLPRDTYQRATDFFAILISSPLFFSLAGLILHHYAPMLHYYLHASSTSMILNIARGVDVSTKAFSEMLQMPLLDNTVRARWCDYVVAMSFSIKCI